ncbi:MAG: HAMP domain-containing sensor histidine kinase [Planctomycetota bacterium]
MKRPWQTWTLFGACLAALLIAMAWISSMALKLDRAESEAQNQAALEENVRLALWRMETLLAGVIAKESNLPYFEYSSFYPLERAYTRMFSQVERGEILVPSRLLAGTPEHALVYFQIDPQGRLTSPQVPEGEMRSLALEKYIQQETLGLAAARLEALAPVLHGHSLLERLPADDPTSPLPMTSNDLILNSAARQTQPAQQELNQQEYQSRSRRKMSNIESQWAQGLDQNLKERNEDPEAGTHVYVGAFTALWVDEMLILARRVRWDAGDYVQGCRLNWAGLKETLVNEIRDLLPGADLLPAPGEANHDDGARRVAALPIRLQPGSLALPLPPGMSVIRISLLIAWGCVVLAGAAVAALLGGALKLSERRGAFVSAVTHELRTPLTTLRMYTEMLARDMVQTPEKRAHYLSTLQTEAERLGHLVENVLAYSRLERKAGEARKETMTIGALVNRVEDRLERHAEMAGMGLEVSLSEEERVISVRTDPGAVEQILFNLVDNASKYAKSADDKTIHLEGRLSGRVFSLYVRDHGPGISGPGKKRLFKPFCKSDHEAALSAPGVGLGLALSRRLAREMGGDLELDPMYGAGASFILTLPLNA